MSPALTPLLVAALLSALDLLVSYPYRLGGPQQGRPEIDALGLFLQVFALFNLRLGFRLAADHARRQGTRPPLWLLGLGLLTAALITVQTIRDLRYSGSP